MKTEENGFDPRDYWETRLTKEYDLSSVGYLGLGVNFNKWLYRVRREVFLKRVESIPINLHKARVLDVGSGTGFYVDLWKELGVGEIVGSDLTQIAVNELSRKYTYAQFHRFDICQVDGELDGEVFDVVSAFDVLFHIIDDDRYRSAITNISDFLRDDGWFLFSEFFLHDEDVRGKHQVSRSLNHIRSLIEKAGFEIYGRYPVFFLMNNPLDTDNNIMKRWWYILSRIIRKGELLGEILGMILFQIERPLVFRLSESPTTELMICRKRNRHQSH